MKGFKDTTKMTRSGSASCYAKGGKVSQAKVGKVMHEWGQGKLHSGSKKGPEVKSQKQAIAIALSEGRKAAKPVAKAEGGFLRDAMIDTKRQVRQAVRRNPDLANRVANLSEMAQLKQDMGAPATPAPRPALAGMKRGGKVLKKADGGSIDLPSDPYEPMPPPLPKDKPRTLRVERTTVSTDDAPQSDLSRRLNTVPSAAEMRQARQNESKGSYRNIPLIGGALGEARDLARTYLGLKKGGLAVKGHKGR